MDITHFKANESSTSDPSGFWRFATRIQANWAVIHLKFELQGHPLFPNPYCRPGSGGTSLLFPPVTLNS